jgi:hypothetical protein
VNTFWVKIAALAVVIFVVILGITLLMPPKQDEPQQQPKTIYDMARKDKKELLAAPSEKDFAPGGEPNQPAEPIVLYFKEVSEIEKFEADRLMQMIPSFRTIGRMPFTGYNVMVESCRQLMNRWPGSRYDYMARRALAQMPERYQGRYRITKEDIDLEYFKKQRPDTKPYMVKEDS